jgi:hypothetical protein
MRSLGAIVLGISAYQYEVEVVDAPPLKYTVKDADAITEYLEAAGPRRAALS